MERSSRNMKKMQKGASFNGQTTVVDQKMIRRPMTEPDLLSNKRTKNKSSPERPPIIRHTSASALANHGVSGTTATGDLVRKTPAKVLVNVTVQRCMWPLQVMASAEWSVTDLVCVVLKQYVKEARRPVLISTEASTYGLHYSQFSLECLDSDEKVIELDSRNFFLCPKSKVSPASDSNSTAPLSSSSSSCSKEAHEIRFPWHTFMEFLL